MSPTTVLDYADEYRRMLMALEKSRVQRYISAYTPIYKDLSMQISALTAELAMMDDPKVWKVNKLQRLTDLKKQVAAELNDFGTFVDRDIRADVKKFVEMGLDHSEALVYAGMPKELAGVIASQWNRLPVEAVQTAMGFFEPGSPLHAKLNETLGPHIANLIGDKVTKGIATGMNPQTIGRLLNTTLGVGLNSAMNTARTSMLYAYREAGRANYLANSDIVDQWIWGAHLNDERTCMACIMMHGTKYPLTQPLNDHFMGRCTMIPFTKSWEELGVPGIADTRPQVESGEDWFNKLPEAEQRRRMGSKAYEAWKEGKITLKDLVTTHDNDVYGPMIGVRSLSGKASGGTETKPAESVALPERDLPPWDDPVFESYDKLDGANTLNVINKNLKKFADSQGITVEELETRIEANIRSLADGNGVSIKASSSSANLILDSGRFKSQFETGKSNGLFNTKTRANAENKGLGVPSTIDPSKRPLYGFLNHERSLTNMYGEVEFVLNDNVLSRTTWTLGDSLRPFGNHSAQGAKFGDWGDKRAWDHNFEGMSLDDAKKFYNFENYIEMQIHGGVSIDDIAEVVIYRRPESTFRDPKLLAKANRDYELLIQRLEQAGIKWRQEQYRA